METKNKIVNQERLKELISFNAELGVFFWISGKQKGLRAESKHNSGYLCVRIDGRSYLLHRLAWLYIYGRFPEKQIDHINGVRSDNRLINLRECSNAENCQNVKPHKDGSGLTGVSYYKRISKWQSGIGINGKRIGLGYFDTKEDAHIAYLDAKKHYHKFGEKNV